AIEAMIAVTTSGGTIVRSSVTKLDPIVARVSVSQFGMSLPSASTPTGPMRRATAPSTTPRTSEMRIWTENEGSRSRRRGCSVGVPLEAAVSVEDMEMLQVGGGGGRGVAAGAG